MEKKQLKQIFDAGKLAALLYIVSPVSCLYEHNDEVQSQEIRHSAVYVVQDAADQKSAAEKKPSLYDLKEKPKVIVFSGHEQNNGGAMSSTGVNEYEYNDRVVAQFRDLESPLEYITHLATENIDIKQRPALAEQSSAQVYVEIHHDSVNRKDLRSAKASGENGQRKYGGFSLHINPNGRWFYDDTKAIAVGMKDCFIDARLEPNTYHAEEDTGIRMQVAEEGVYTRPGLYILRNAKIPTLIVEAGSIVVPQEEAIMRKKETQETIVRCIDATLIQYFENK
ncbi:N-acetylmuramoyl-L-alanine amidase [Candidatus Woesearchaeota archaeon]|nr:N-acetylmuramoyl-L-alanine amidase [Candidatus Woesearchaeota archaeon]